MAQNIFEVTEITFGLTEDQNITSNLKFIKTRGYQLNKKFIGDDEWVEKTSGPVKELKIIESPKLFDSIISKGGLINIDPSVEDFDQPLFKKPIDKLEKLAETYIPDGAESGNEKTAVKMIFSKKGSSDVFTLIAVRNVGYAIYDNQGTEVDSGDTTEPGLEIETDPSKSPPVGGGGTTTPTDPTNPTIQKIVDTIGQPLGINQQNLDSIANWITNHQLYQLLY